MKKLLSGNLLVMLAAVTLVTAVLVTNCFSPIEEKIQEEKKEDDFIPFDPPAGMGYIRIKVVNDARTIIPSLPAVSTLGYRIVVSNASGTAYDSDDVNSGNPISFSSLTTNPIMILPGTYDVLVTAYNSGSTTEIVGKDEVKNVVVGSSGETVSITLEPNKTEGSGKFSYNITLPSNEGSASGAFSALLTVTTYPGNVATIITNANLVTTPNNTASPTPLASGFYYVTIVMTDPGVPGTPADFPNLGDPAVPAVLPALQPRTVSNILHIYQNITTDYGTTSTPITLAALNLFRYMVTYDANGGNTLVPATPFGPFAHGSTLTLATDAPATPTHSDSSMIFNKWVRDKTNPSTAAATEWVFSTTKLIGPITLYATWSQAVTLTLTINWTNIADLVFTQTASFEQSKYYNGTTQTATLHFAQTGYTLIEWKDEDGTTIGTGDVILNNSSNTNYFSTGNHVFTAMVEDTTQYTDAPTNSILNPNYGNIYSVYFTLTVTP